MRSVIQTWQSNDTDFRKSDHDNRSKQKTRSDEEYYPESASRFIDRLDAAKYFEFRSDKGWVAQKNDREDYCIKSGLGLEHYQQVYYWNFRDTTDESQIFHNVNTYAQISGLKYNKETEKYYGLELDTKGNYQREVELTDKWMKDNFKELMDSLKERAINKNQPYYNVPLQDPQPSRKNRGNSSCPKIVYKQGEERTCAFDSLCSAFSYLRFDREAKSLHEFRNYFYKHLYQQYFDKIPECMMRFIRSNDEFKYFRRQYGQIRLSSNHLVYNFGCDAKDIRFLQIAGTDGSVSHAICIIGGYIFDSNCDFALKFNEANMNDCCNESLFDHVVMGYHFKLHSP
jgi:hypothetical protein